MPAQKEASAITEIPAPASKKQVPSLIRMINYLSKFSVRLLELVEPIGELVKEKVPFNWGPEHKKAFNLMKKEIAKLQYLFNITQESKLFSKQVQV